MNDLQLVHRTPKGEELQGLMCLGKEVFVVRCEKSEVDVYDVNTLTKQRRLPVSGLSLLCDTPLCALKKCLFSIDYDGKRVYRVDLNGRVTSWTVNGNICGLSMAAKCNVLVTLYSTSKLKEFTRDGQFIQEISLQ